MSGGITVKNSAKTDGSQLNTSKLIFICSPDTKHSVPDELLI